MNPRETRPTMTVVVPALNEEDNLRPTVEAILKDLGPLASELEVLVFDDASTDRTGAVADELAEQDTRVRAIHNRERVNIGGSYKAGLARARGEFYLLVPGDNETRVDEIARGLAFVGRADLILFHVTNPRVRGTARRLLSRAYVVAVNVLFGTRFRYTNGTNVFRTAILKDVPIRTNGFSYQTEAVVKAVRSGVNYVEVGLEIKARDTGTSKAVTWKNLKSVAAALSRLWWDVRVTHRAAYRMRGRKVGAF